MELNLKFLLLLYIMENVFCPNPKSGYEFSFLFPASTWILPVVSIHVFFLKEDANKSDETTQKSTIQIKAAAI
jgi:hypothetical protein